MMFILDLDGTSDVEEDNIERVGESHDQFSQALPQTLDSCIHILDPRPFPTARQLKDNLKAEFY